ncbi:hypothetical protein FRC07_008543 [Ceratobasidium sp. 392]|nr:hypothetical protein FRC07_008543 [Ceratobasidium sp. 392]
MSGYSDPSSSANMSSPVRPSASGFPQPSPYTSPPGGYPYPGPTGHPLEYPSSGSDAFQSSEQYTSPSPGKYMSSPEQMHLGQLPQQQTRPMTSIFGTTSPPFTSPTRPGPAPYVASGDQAWQPTTGLAPSSSLVPISGNASSGGSSGGGGGGGRSSGGYSTGSNPNNPARPIAGVGSARKPVSGGGNASRYQHTHSQSGDGHLAPPRPTKRHHPNPDEDEDSDSEDENAGQGHKGGSGGPGGTTKRLFDIVKSSWD